MTHTSHPLRRRVRPRRGAGLALAALALSLALPSPPAGARTVKPVLHGRHWVAITGKPLGATAGARIFVQGGNAVDAACAMLAAVATMWDTLGWGGETQALIYDPTTGRVHGVNALGVAPAGATPEFFRERGMAYPPEHGALAAVTPGTPGGLLTMLAEWGTMSLEQVLAPAIEMADGYPIEAALADRLERERKRLEAWSASRRVFLPHLDPEDAKRRAAPAAGEIFRQPELAATLRKLVDAERAALAAGKGRREAILAAYDRFYRGDVARDLVAGTHEEGGLIALEDLDRWRVKIEEPVSTTYRGIEVYKLTTWTQGPALLQALNLLENADLKALGYNSAAYLHLVAQAMHLAFADRDFYYGDPDFQPAEPVAGLLSKDYARARFATIDRARNDPGVRPGDPYPYQGGENPFRALLDAWPPPPPATEGAKEAWMNHDEAFRAGTTSIQAADAAGWVVSITPSGAWVPAVIAGTTGIGLSQRAQSFVLDARENPFNVLEPGKRPRVTLTPSLALKDGKPYLSFAVQGGDSQDQNLLQFFLNVVEFGMNVQEATEAANLNTYQMRSSFGDHAAQPGRIEVREDVPPWVRAELETMGYKVETRARTSGPINALWFDREHGTIWGGSSDHGEDYGIAW